MHYYNIRFGVSVKKKEFVETQHKFGQMTLIINDDYDKYYGFDLQNKKFEGIVLEDFVENLVKYTSKKMKQNSKLLSAMVLCGFNENQDGIMDYDENLLQNFFEASDWDLSTLDSSLFMIVSYSNVNLILNKKEIVYCGKKYTANSLPGIVPEERSFIYGINF
jgi:hypothetical protein